MSLLFQVALNDCTVTGRLCDHSHVLFCGREQVVVKPYVHIFMAKVKLFGATAAACMIELER